MYRSVLCEQPHTRHDNNKKGKCPLKSECSEFRLQHVLLSTKFRFTVAGPFPCMESSLRKRRLSPQTRPLLFYQNTLVAIRYNRNRSFDESAPPLSPNTILSALYSPQKQTHNTESFLRRFHALSVPYHRLSPLSAFAASITKKSSILNCGNLFTSTP